MLAKGKEKTVSDHVNGQCGQYFRPCGQCDFLFLVHAEGKDNFRLQLHFRSMTISAIFIFFLWYTDLCGLCLLCHFWLLGDTSRLCRLSRATICSNKLSVPLQNWWRKRGRQFVTTDNLLVFRNKGSEPGRDFQPFSAAVTQTGSFYRTQMYHSTLVENHKSVWLGFKRLPTGIFKWGFLKC